MLDVSSKNRRRTPFSPISIRIRKSMPSRPRSFFYSPGFNSSREIAQLDLFNQVTLSDYLFDKDRIFALLNLDEHELALYDKIFQLLEGRLPTPDLVIFLQAKPEVLLQRIKSRNIPYEKEIELEYLKRLTEAYNYYFFHYDQSPLLVVNTSEIDFVKRKEDLDQLLREIKKMKKGTWYFTPMRSK